ncbi:unnamed protein product [Withania somnifera]
MEAVLQIRGILSRLPNPKPRFFIHFASRGLRHRFNSLNLLKPKPRNGLSLSSNGFQIFQGFSTKHHLLLLLCDGQPLFADKEPPKFMGIELVTLKKIIPLGAMFFCNLFNYTILRDTKDVLVVTTKGSSVEIIPFLKTWVNLPMAIGFILLYTKLDSVLSKEDLFNLVILSFITFFGAFGFVLYPLSNYFHPTAFADKLLNTLGPRFLRPISMLEDPEFLLITTVDEAKRFYPLFGLGANVALIFSGCTVKYFSSLRSSLGPGVDVLMGGAIYFFCGWVNRNVPLPTRSKKNKVKPNMTMMESMKFLVSSKYIGNLATLVVAYGISINLVEVTWKSKLKARFPSPNKYSSFMGDFSTTTLEFKKKITPTVLLVTGVGFFSLLLFGSPLAPTLAKFGMTPLLGALYVGAMQNIFGKSAKYSLFDPLEVRRSSIQQFMILTFGSLAISTPYLGGVLLVIVLVWLAAAKSLDERFTTLRQKEELEKEMERASLKIPIVSQNGNGPLSSGSSPNPTGGDSTGTSFESSSPRSP